MRRLPFGLGLLALAAAWLLPLPTLLPGAFAAHMTMHMTVVAVAAPLLALGLAGGKLDLARNLRTLGAAIPVSIVELVVVWAWHAPALHLLARHTRSGLVIEQGSFLASALLVWLLALGGGSEQRPARNAAGIVALLLTSMHMTLLGALIALAPRPLFAVHAAAGSTLGPLEDQHLGGAIMLLVGGVSYLMGALYLAVHVLAEPRGRGVALVTRPGIGRRAGAAATEGDS